MKAAGMFSLLMACAFMAACDLPQAGKLPPPAQGIDAPVTVKGISFVITAAELYSGPYNRIRPTASEHILFIVRGDVLSGNAEEMREWEVFAGEYPRSVNEVTNLLTDGKVVKSMFTWYFSVPVGEDPKYFPLSLPDGQTIDLSPLLDD